MVILFPLPLMVDLPQVLGIASIGNLCKVYKTILKKWSRKKNASANESQIEGNKEVHKEHAGDDRQEKETMNGIHSFRYNGEGVGGNGSPTSHLGGHFYRHRSTDCFPSIPSPVSRSASRRSNTPIRTSFFRSMSRKSTESIPSPSSNVGQKVTESSTSSPSFLSKSVSRKSSTRIMFSNSSGTGIKPPAIERKLECTLEELCYGCTRKVKITRDVVSDTGQITQEEELLTIKVKPGWKKGTKITFEGMGNERPGICPADITFVIAEKRHPMFRREGDDLELAVRIPLLKALTGCTLSIPLLGGEKMSLKIDDIIYPGYEKIIDGKGMPNSKAQGKRGSFKITFLVDFPKELTDEQRSDILSILQDSC
ncbi:dnaJ homolog subfamily A member 2 [Fagus crenata]